ncbi:MAG: DUF58 domain-containing protein [Myxococcota bacterium]
MNRAWAWTALANEERQFGALHRVDLRTRRRVQSTFLGAYASTFHGQGMTFADLRLYQPGDEVRWIDWNVTARAGEVYVKQFVEERDRTLLLLCDVSASMDWGSQFLTKRWAMLEIAMILAWSAQSNNDKVGLLCFDHEEMSYIGPRSGTMHVQRLMRHLMRWRAQSQSGFPNQQRTRVGKQTTQQDKRFVDNPGDVQSTSIWTRVWPYVQKVAPRHSIVFALTDLSFDVETQSLLRAARKMQVQVIGIRDRSERVLPDVVWKRQPRLSPFFWALCMLLWVPFFLGRGEGFWACASATVLAFSGAWSLHGVGGWIWCCDLEKGQTRAVALGNSGTQTLFHEASLAEEKTWTEALKRKQVPALFVESASDCVGALRGFFEKLQASKI